MYILNNLKTFWYYVFCIFLCSYAGGCQKKRSPLQKWLTWFMMTINKENVNKSCVFVPHSYRYLRLRTTLIAILKYLLTDPFNEF